MTTAGQPITLTRVADPEAPTQVGTAVLRVTGVGKAFHRGIWPLRRSVQVLSGATLRVMPGELVGLVGENGSGKSTLLQIIVGLLARDSGSIERPGRLGYCPQQAMLWDKLTVDEHFALFARAYGMDTGAREQAAGDMLEELQFAAYRGYRVEELSGGTRQKLNLALAESVAPFSGSSLNRVGIVGAGRVRRACSSSMMGAWLARFGSLPAGFGASGAVECRGRQLRSGDAEAGAGAGLREGCAVRVPGVRSGGLQGARHRAEDVAASRLL